MTWTQRREAVFCIIEWLVRGGVDFYGATFPDDFTAKKARRVWKQANQRHSIMSISQVEKFRSAADIDFGDKVALITPPGGVRDNVALLHCHWKHNNGVRQCRLYYGLWQLMHTFPHPELPQPATILAFSAHRLELSERGTNHNYHHAQYCRSLGPPGTNEPLEAIRLPDTYPAWPISAHDELHLALCFIVALYGFIGFAKFEDHVQQSNKWRHHTLLGEAIMAIRRLQQ